VPGVVITISGEIQPVARQLVPLLARHFACLAPDAERGIGEKPHDLRAIPRLIRLRHGLAMRGECIRDILDLHRDIAERSMRGLGEDGEGEGHWFSFPAVYNLETRTGATDMAREQLSPYIFRDEYGMLRVGETKVSLDGIVYAFDGGESAEEIFRNYAAVTLEQVYGAIAYYLGHREEVQEYLRRNRAEYERLRAENEKIPNPARDRLRAMLRQREQAGLTKRAGQNFSLTTTLWQALSGAPCARNRQSLF
jgi:uncharacterized protein (DUF433 family)